MAIEIKQNKWARRVAWGVGGLAAVWGLAWLAVPPLLKSQVEKVASEQLGRRVTVGSIDFKPWTLELTVGDLAIATADGSGDQLRIKRIYADAELQSILRLAPVVDAIQVDEPKVRLTHLGGGKYDIDDILAKLAQAPAKPKGEPPRFALYNVALTGGALDFADKSVNKTHELRDLKISLPFLSNLASQRDVKVTPQLGFTLNGSRFDSAAQGTPFAQTRKTDATLDIKALDLAPYLGYWPASLPVRLESAVLQADLKIAFEQSGGNRVSISGSLGADQVSLVPGGRVDPGAPTAAARGTSTLPRLLAFDSLRVQLADLQPLAQSVKLTSIDLVGPRLAVSRDRAGRINLQQLTGEPAGAPEKIAREGLPAGTPPEKPSKSGGWKLELDRFSLNGGLVGWRDETTAPAVALALSQLQLQATAVAWPFTAPLQFTGSSRLEGASLTFSGSATDQSASVTAALTALPLKVASPYMQGFLEPSLAGSVSAELALGWKAPDLSVGISRLTLADLALNAQTKAAANPASAASLASIKKLEITSAQVDLAKATVVVGKVAVNAPRLRVERDAGGHWMFERWLKSTDKAPATAVTVPDSASKPAKAQASPWSFAINEIAIDGGTVAYEDQLPIRPVAVDVSALQLRMKRLELGGKPGERPASPLDLSLRIAAGRLEPGKLDFAGAVGLAPLAVRGKLNAERLPVHAFEAYFADALNIELLRADTSFKGEFSFAQLASGPKLELGGDVALEDFRANSVVASAASGNNSVTAVVPLGVDASQARISEELLSWKALGVRGLQVSVAPGSATVVNVRETALSDVFARVAINEQGRINLQDIVKSAPSATGTSATTAAQVTPTVATSAANPGPAAVVNIGPISVTNGRALFSDRFIKPNYSANLSELNGRLSAFSSVSPTGTPQLADLELRGRAQSTASLEILGRLNPLAKPLALDIKGKVRDLELPPLSAYAVKYAGYGIERGKLSVDVAYLIKPDGQLTASNKIVLNQLAFGDKVEGAPNSLPVKLAVALLADRNGVIDLDLPISGSLNDPQFSIGGIIFKVIVNLVVKAITAPFSLLAAAFGGGGAELNTVYFEPGTTALADGSADTLDKIAKALTDRPSLKLTVVGTSSLDAERDAYQHERLQALVRAEKRRAAVVGGADTGTSTRAITVSAEEYPALLKEVYKRTDMTKPRNVVGIAKDLPLPEMEGLLLAHIPVTEDIMRELAVRRGVAVKDYLAKRDLPVERLFLGAAKTVPPEAKWSPRAELNLVQ